MAGRTGMYAVIAVSKEDGITELWNAVPHMAEAQKSLMKLVREIKLYEDNNENHGDRDYIEGLIWDLNKSLQFANMHIRDEDGAVNQFRDSEFIDLEDWEKEVERKDDV